MDINSTAQFTATVRNTSNTAVIWSTTGGSITADGLFTAPSVARLCEVTVALQVDPTKTASARVYVQATTPHFTSTPGTTAEEGVQYSYTAGAADSGGSTVTMALIDAPIGATFDGQTVTWIPTNAQSRVPNSFTLEARTPAGGANENPDMVRHPSGQRLLHPAFTFPH